MSEPSLPLVLAGPILRRITSQRLTIWLATTEPVEVALNLQPVGAEPSTIDNAAMMKNSHQLRAGEHLFFYLLDIPLASTLPTQVWINYDLQLTPKNQVTTSQGSSSEAKSSQGWQDWAGQLNYPEQNSPGFVIAPNVSHMLHGSCRKPHFDSGDGLVIADDALTQLIHQWQAQPSDIAVPQDWPSLLMQSGDQVYADDVATPMLVACHQLIQRLGIYDERFNGANVLDSCELHEQKQHYCQRADLLPGCEHTSTHTKKAVNALFRSVEKPVFTSDNADNHLISLAEVLAMYLLVWSPNPWQLVDIQMPSSLTSEQQQLFNQEQAVIRQFIAGLPQVQRVMAHLPCAMIFDDHDVTDDWNLTAGWELAAYGQAFSKRILGNAMIGYLLCQGWGNAPEHFSDEVMQQLGETLSAPGKDSHDAFIQQLIHFHQWHYQWPTTPALVVLDTRTHRWRSERNIHSPSGLMDWESLTDLQQTLLGKDAVILVSPAPIFGVKLIEVIQKVFTWCGQPLMIDAENWMAHPGAANTLLNMFRHSKTPQNFVILSGDVHYSFAYSIHLKDQQQSPHIWQITSSGIKNEFPGPLLEVLDRLNRWLYAPYSPLNWFTRRRRMRITPHKPSKGASGERLVNASGIGYVNLSDDGSPIKVQQWTTRGDKITFEIKEDEGRWE
ncbi:alkaline phosphatase D family protein [Motilimonas pumila]|uniref:Alkaline phosphatase family protein n=1 Tax=Motilimonas pumila TaxID=2303987 RepID=A0A418YK24_9GAMM|nr:alkaline phosphatase D family protein [Motilimonas pumila]RJG51327.1 alkaline phosphatase family protein [Motilimonas pumila]